MTSAVDQIISDAEKPVLDSPTCTSSKTLNLSTEIQNISNIDPASNSTDLDFSLAGGYSDQSAINMLSTDLDTEVESETESKSKYNTFLDDIRNSQVIDRS